MADDPVPLSGLPDWMLPVSKVPFSSMAGIFNDAPDWGQMRETDPTAGLTLGANVAPSDHERRTLDAIRRGVGRIADDPIGGSAYVASKIPGMLYNAYTNADAPPGMLLASAATPTKGPGAVLGEAEAAAATPGITAYHGSPDDEMTGVLRPGRSDHPIDGVSLTLDPQVADYYARSRAATGKVYQVKVPGTRENYPNLFDFIDEYEAKTGKSFDKASQDEILAFGRSVGYRGVHTPENDELRVFDPVPLSTLPTQQK